MEFTRRELLEGGAGLGVATAVGYGIYRGMPSATFEGWTPEPGTWPQHRYGRGYTAHNPHASPPRSKPTKRALAAVEYDQYSVNALVVGESTVTVAGNDFLVVDREDGSTRNVPWNTTPVAGYGGPPDGRLYAVRQDVEFGDDERTTRHAVVRFDPEAEERTPETVATFDDRGVLNLTVGTDELYVGLTGGDVAGVGLDGGRRWLVRGRKPILGDGRLYAAYVRAPVGAYGPRGLPGRIVQPGPRSEWKASDDGLIARTGGVPSWPATAGSRVVFGNADVYGPGVVSAYEAATGDRLWERRLGESTLTPALAEDRGYTVFDTEDDGEFVVALDLDSGETVWRAELPGARFPVVGGDVVLVSAGGTDDERASAGTLHAYDRHGGDRLWSVGFEGGVGPEDFVPVDDRIYVVAHETLYELA